MKRLPVFRRFPHDPQSILAAVYGFALVSIKLRLNVGIRRWKAGLELRIAPFAYADGWRRAFLHDPQAFARHYRSLPHSGGIGWPVDAKRHHYPIVLLFVGKRVQYSALISASPRTIRC